MKKVTRSQLESKLRTMYLEEHQDEMLSLEEMKKRASYEYEARQKMQKRKKAGMPQRLIVIASLAVFLLGGSFLFSMFSPMLVTNANSFVRKATIWINDVFHLGIEIEKPLETPDAGMKENTKTSFESVQEAASYFDVPLLVLKDGVSGSLIKAPKAVAGIQPFYTLEYKYQVDGMPITITFERILETTAFHLFENFEEVKTPLGQTFVWIQEDMSQLLVVHNGFFIFITTDAPVDQIIFYIDLFEWIN